MVDQKKNPRNAASPLFKRLTRLFSGPLVNYRAQQARREKRANIDKHGRRFKSISGQQFKKQAYDPFGNMTADVMLNQGRIERYVDFEQMEYMPEIASALDIYADEMTTSSTLQPLLTIDCPNEEIKAVLDSLYHNIMNVEFNMFGWCRTMCKFGDFFLYLDIDEEKGIINTIGMPSNEVERLEGQDPTNPSYVQFQWNSAGMTFENWQVSHFRILGNDKYAPYGTAVLDAARRIWRQLVLLEDAMMAYRIVRAPDRRVFYIDVGNVAPQDVEQYVQKVVTQMKRNQIVDTSTGRVDLRYNPLSIEEDYFLPVRGTTNTKIENLSGGSYTGDIDDVKYLRDKLFSALKVPMSYLSRGEGGEEDKTTLAQKDIRFARTIQRLQRSAVSELEKIGIVHLYTLGFRGDDLISFKIALSNPSKIAELQELEQWKTKFDTAASATEGFFSKRWIAKKMFNLSEEEFLRNQREMFYDRKFDAALEAVAEQAAAEAAGGGMGGDLGGDMGGEDLGGEDLGGDMGEEDLGGDLDLGGDDEDLGGGPDEGDLLAEPAGKRRSPKPMSAKGKLGHAAGRKSMSMSYLSKPEVARSVKRREFPGVYGYGGLNSLVTNPLNEVQETTYEEEQKLFELSHDVKRLISGLEAKENNDVEDEAQ